MDNDMNPDSHNPQDRPDRVALRVMGISYNQLQSGVYALLLAQQDGPYRIPVMIGPAEAQSIAMRIEGVIPPRPLTHDLIKSILKAFGMRMTAVDIYRFEDGVFYSEITLTDGERTVTIDSRTSDAIAMALRLGTPVYTTPEVLEQTGFEMEEMELDENTHKTRPQEEDTLESRDVPRIEQYSIEELERTLAELIEKEDYEEAARVSAILDRKRGKK